MKLPAEMMKLAQHIIHTKAAAFDPAMLEDHYRNAIVRILRKKHAKLPDASAPRRELLHVVSCPLLASARGDRAKLAKTGWTGWFYQQ